MADLEFDLGLLRSRCEALVEFYGGGEGLAASAGGLYYAFKSVRFVAKLHRELMSEPALLHYGNGDEAGYFAESMIRSVHSSGDLLATVLVECGRAPRPKGDVYLSRLDLTSAPALGSLVDELLASPAWDYIGAFTNTSKHNAFIDRTSVSIDEHDNQEIVFLAFDYRGRTLPERSFGEVVACAGELMDIVERILDQLLVEAPRPSEPTAPQVEVRISPITASFTAPSKASFTRREFRLGVRPDSDDQR